MSAIQSNNVTNYSTVTFIKNQNTQATKKGINPTTAGNSPDQPNIGGHHVQTNIKALQDKIGAQVSKVLKRQDRKTADCDSRPSPVSGSKTSPTQASPQPAARPQSGNTRAKQTGPQPDRESTVIFNEPITETIPAEFIQAAQFTQAPVSREGKVLYVKDMNTRRYVNLEVLSRMDIMKHPGYDKAVRWEDRKTPRQADKTGTPTYVIANNDFFPEHPSGDRRVLNGFVTTRLDVDSGVVKTKYLTPSQSINTTQRQPTIKPSVEASVRAWIQASFDAPAVSEKKTGLKKGITATMPTQLKQKLNNQKQQAAINAILKRR